MKSNLEIAIAAAIAAGNEILKVYESDFSVETKEDQSPLTLADEKSNDVINAFLQETNIPIISEENKQMEYSVRKEWDRCWIVDPLDGTKEFIKRNGEFTVNIALVTEGVPKLGVIYVPVSKELYFTSEDATASYKITFQEKATAAYALEHATQIFPAKLSEPVKIVGSRSHLNEDTKAYISEIEKHNSVAIVSKGSSLKFCLVAEGAAHIYPRFAPTMEWDTAAGQAICEAAGVTVINQETQKPLRYNRENLLNPYFLVKVS